MSHYETVLRLQFCDVFLDTLDKNRKTWHIIHTKMKRTVEDDDFDEYIEYLELCARNTSSPRKKKWRKDRNRGYALQEMEHLSEKIFQRMFRMSRRSFKILEDMLKKEISVDERKAVNSSGSVISLRTRLAITLRWLAGGSFLDICFAFGVAPGSFFVEHGPLWTTLSVINKVFKIEFPYENKGALDELSAGFSRFSRGHMTGCVMAIDGWVCRTIAPNDAEVKTPTTYYNRHGCYGLVVLAGCDSQCKFLLFDPNYAGSTQDALAWSMTDTCAIIEDNKLLKEYFIIGDEAFSNTDQVLSPWPGRGLGHWKDSFNYHLSSMRQCIERAFGILTQRWGILWRPLRCRFDKRTLVVTICAKLHNFCIEQSDVESNLLMQRLTEDILEEDCYLVLDNTLENEDYRRFLRENRMTPRSNNARRELITQDLQNQGQRRPLYAMPNCKA